MNKQNDLLIDSLYLHFPFCAHLCNYCDFYKKVSQNKEYDYQAFEKYLEKSFLVHQNLMIEHGYSWAPLKTFYIGGGTPSLWGERGKLFLENFFKKHNLNLAADCEFTLEVNPGAWTEDSITAWRSFGANRFSLGVQSLDASMIRYLDRVHTINDVYETLEYFKKNQLNFSMDFMLGLPFSEVEKRDVILELTKALEYSPSHFSVYILTVKDNYKFFDNLPDEDWIATEFLSVASFLKKADFNHYEVSNFAQSKKESIHNLNYWKSKTVAALGPSATGFLGEKKYRYKWQVNATEFIPEQLNKDEFRLEELYMALRTNAGIKLSHYVSDAKRQEILLKNWCDSGYIDNPVDHVVLSSKGFLFLDSILAEIF